MSCILADVNKTINIPEVQNELYTEGADKKLDYHRALKGAFYVFTRAKRESYTVV